MRHLKCPAVIFVAVMLAAISGNEAVAFWGFTEKTPKIETRPVALLEKIVHGRVNDERLKHNLTTLQWAEDVAEVARKHSQDMALKEYFAHENKESELVAERLEKAGIAFAVSAENLFKCENYPDIVEESVTGWMQSPGHRENILNDQVEEAGIGIYKVSGKDEYYITQDFIKRALKFVPTPSELSEQRIIEIFNITKNAIIDSDYRTLSLKERIVKKLITSGVSVKRDIIIKGFLKENLQMRMKVDLIADNGFIIHLTGNPPEQEKETFGKFITSQGYSAILLIRITKEKVEYVLIKPE
jgi:uncharacterized protein YkwD